MNAHVLDIHIRVFHSRTFFLFFFISREKKYLGFPPCENVKKTQFFVIFLGNSRYPFGKNYVIHRDDHIIDLLINHFIRGCRLVYLCLSLPPPVFLSFRSLRSLSFICIKREGGGKDINKPNGNPE
jgi:hypothetical protein